MVDHVANLRTVASVLRSIGENPKFPASRTSATEMAVCVTAAADYFSGPSRIEGVILTEDAAREDHVDAFMKARVRRVRKATFPVGFLYTLYTRWCAARGIAPVAMSTLVNMLMQRGLKRGNTRGTRNWLDTDVIPGEEDDIAEWKDRAAQRYVAHGGLPLNTALAFATPTWEDVLKAENGIVAKALQTDPVAAVDDDISCWEA